MWTERKNITIFIYSHAEKTFSKYCESILQIGEKLQKQKF